MHRTLFLLAGVILSSAQQGCAQDTWAKASTSHFELYTERNDPEAASDTLKLLETAHQFFRGTIWAEGVPRNPVRIVAFENAATYSPFFYDLSPHAVAFYRHVQQHDIIAMKSLRGLPGRVVVHEYVHSIFFRLSPNLPLWLVEGLAEAYSSNSIESSRLVFGAMRPDYLETLPRPTVERTTAVFSVRTDSPVYTSQDGPGCFYSLSWAATHMLLLDAKYAGRFKLFLSAVINGNTKEALTSIYGVSVEQFTKDLVSYLERSKWADFDALMPEVTVSITHKTNLTIEEIHSVVTDLSSSDQPSQAQEINSMQQHR